VDLPDGRILTLHDDIIEVSDAEAYIHSAVKLAEPCHNKTVTIDDEGEYMLPCGGRITAAFFRPPEHFSQSQSFPKTVWLDVEQAAFPLELRYRKPGDRFMPINFPEEVRLKKFLINRKVPRETRNRLPLLVRHDTILAVTGLEVSEKGKLKQGSKMALCIKLDDFPVF
jgi:tRNA(Ile)-lysidine synthase